MREAKPDPIDIDNQFQTEGNLMYLKSDTSGKNERWPIRCASSLRRAVQHEYRPDVNNITFELSYNTIPKSYVPGVPIRLY
jgi:phosphatidylethanolamine-binding protein (PEBP) family uncharacterized protein